LKTAEVVPFKSPPDMEMSFRLPSGRDVTGMAILRGVTLIVGGGFHGKSTILQGLEAGVYNHIPGDGREFVVTDPASVKIRAEDGRGVKAVDIRPFINNLPYGKDTSSFSTTNASGSTSQAANILEALEVGCSTLLIDEDTCATNFMIRDERMQRLVSKEKEPITPFIYKVRQLYVELGVSSIMVVGGSGDYFDVADKIILMDSYSPRNVTDEAKAIAAEMPSNRAAEGGSSFGVRTPRCPVKSSLAVVRNSKVKVRDHETVSIGEDINLDLSGVEQLIEASQTRAIVDAIAYAEKHDLMARHSTLKGIVQGLDELFTQQGLDALSAHHLGTYARPRVFEIAAAFNRLRSNEFLQADLR